MLTGLTVLKADRMDTVDVIDWDVQTALPVNLVNTVQNPTLPPQAVGTPCHSKSSPQTKRELCCDPA